MPRLATFQPAFEMIPHPAAPIFSKPDAASVLNQILGEVESGNFPANETFIKLIAQAGLTSLWFFLKVIAAHSGPYNLLNDKLHLDMCNFRQKGVLPGARLGMFVPRSSLKSTICTHGAAAWTLTRNPNDRIAIFSGVYDRAQQFFHAAQRIIDSNELYAACYPQNVPSRNDGTRWNDSEAVLPSRTRFMPEPSLFAMTAGGSTQGIHVDEGLVDDIVGDDDLDANRGATADMYKKKNWFDDNQRTLLQTPEESRLILSATRYSIDDPYEGVMRDAFEHCGWWEPIESEYPLKKDGEWSVYYRQAREMDDSIFPAKYSVEWLSKLAKEKPDTYRLHYENNPVSVNAVEFAAYKPYSFSLCHNEDRGWEIVIDASQEVVRLADCDLVMAIDPAGSERMASIKTSRSTVVLLARDKKDRHFVVQVRAGYVATTKWFDWAFELKQQFGELLRATYVEQQAGFRSLTSIIRAEEARRGKWLNYMPVNALGDKVVTIRNLLQPLLEKYLLYINSDCRELVDEELRTFPASIKRDILDALKISVKMSIRPDGSEEDEEYADEMRHMRQLSINPYTGY
jgi:hypothetical protein